MLPQHHCNCSKLSLARNQWASFEKYVAFQTRQGNINTYDKFKTMVTLTLTDIAWKWFETIMNGIQDMASLKEKFLKRFNSYGR